uniref:FLYWCH-type domain-containing protein n=1 Tax=Trichuris muris TaxID=70415 RepID=A0A5S6QL08_TRIMR
MLYVLEPYGHSMERENGRHATWKCSQKVCRKEITVGKGTWLEDTQQELRKVAMFLFFWSQERASVNFCERTLGMSKSTSTEWSSSIRQIISRSFPRRQVVLG